MLARGPAAFIAHIKRANLIFAHLIRWGAAFGHMAPRAALLAGELCAV